MSNTKKAVLENNSELKTIINAVINRVGMSSIDDINNHGINGGYCGFIYYTDTHRFAMRHRRQIVEMLKNDADQMGVELSEMIKSFGVFRNLGFDSEDEANMYRYLGFGKCEQSTITNVMAWYAAETVCRMFED